MINVLGLIQEDKDVINGSFQQLCEQYTCTLENDKIDAYNNLLVNTQLIFPFTTVSLKNIFRLEKNGHVFELVSIYMANPKENLPPRVMIYGFAEINSKAGNILIKPKGFLDRMFGGPGIKMKEPKAFNDKYYLETRNAEKAVNGLSAEFLNAIAGMEKMDLEFYDNHLLCNLPPKISIDKTMKLAEFMEKVVPMLGK